MTSRLSLYNLALHFVGERSLSSLTENQEVRYKLDNAWNEGAVDLCLEEGDWFFAMRTVQIDYDSGIEPEFGYRRAFQKPSDWITTSALSADEYFNAPLTQYSDEAGYWYSDHDTLYVRYISNDSAYGGDLSRWPNSFVQFVGAHLASKIALGLSAKDSLLDKMLKLRKKLLSDAKNKCAKASPTRFPPRGSWTRSRSSGARSTGNGGDRGGPD